LDADPTHGAFKEPLIKILGLMRSLQFELHDNVPWAEFTMLFGRQIGQMAHQIPSVFSFFLPEYQPSGKSEMPIKLFYLAISFPSDLTVFHNYAIVVIHRSNRTGVRHKP
jgi:hypothetical protein